MYSPCNLCDVYPQTLNPILNIKPPCTLVLTTTATINIMVTMSCSITDHDNYRQHNIASASNSKIIASIMNSTM